MSDGDNDAVHPELNEDNQPDSNVPIGTKRALSPLLEDSETDLQDEKPRDAKLFREMSPPSGSRSTIGIVTTTVPTDSPGRRSHESSQGSTSSGGSTQSCMSSSTSDDGRYTFTRQLSINAAIRAKVSDWKAYNSTDNITSSNIFDVLPIHRTHLTYVEFKAKLSLVLLSAWENTTQYQMVDIMENYFVQAEKIIFALHQNMKFSIPRGPRKVHGSVKAYAMYPYCRDDNQLLDPDAKKDVERDLRFFTSMMFRHVITTLKQNKNFEDVGNYNIFPDTAVVQVAGRNFMEDTVQFLVQQGSITEHHHERLFSSFCAVAGLELRHGCDIETRKMQILGVNVSCVPGLRAVRPLIPQVQRGVDLEKITPRTVVAVVEVKSGESRRLVVESDFSQRQTRQSVVSASTSPATATCLETVGSEAMCAEQCITDVLGQLTGEMLAELLSEETAFQTKSNSALIGFAVQCTQVQVVIMSLPHPLVQYIKTDPTLPMKEYEDAYGDVWFSSPYDMLVADDRLKLWRLVSMVSASAAIY